MIENKALLLKLMTEVIEDFSLDIKSIDFYENTKETRFGTEIEIIMKISWWDNCPVTYGRYFSLTDMKIIKRDPKAFISFMSEELKRHIKKVKGELYE